MPAFRSLVLAGAVAALTQLGGCTTLETMETDFEQAWKEPPVQVTPQEPPITAGMTEESFAELDKKMRGLSADKECRTIIRIAARLIAHQPDYAPAELKWASCNYDEGDYAAARARYLRIVEAGPNAEAYEGLGFAELHLGNPAEARKYLLLANETGGSTSADVSNALGFLDDQSQQWEGAEKHYLKAVALAPKSGAALNNLGMSYMRQQRYMDAAAAFARSVHVQPNLQIARLNLRIAQAMAGGVSTALSGASENDKAVVMNNLGVAALARGDDRSARSYFETALTLSPSFYPNAYANLELAGSSDRVPVAAPIAPAAAAPVVVVTPAAAAVPAAASPASTVVVPAVVVPAAVDVAAAVVTPAAEVASILASIPPAVTTPSIAGVADAVSDVATPAAVDVAPAVVAAVVADASVTGGGGQ